MTFLEAFRNRGLLVPERNRPVYAIVYSNGAYGARYFQAEATTPQAAKQEIAAAWIEYANKHGVSESTILDMWCIGNGGIENNDAKRLDFLRSTHVLSKVNKNRR